MTPSTYLEHCPNCNSTRLCLGPFYARSSLCCWTCGWRAAEPEAST